MPIWWWSGDALDPERLTEQLDALIAGGVHQAVVMNLAPSGPLYGALADDPVFFSEQWWAVFRKVCSAAAERGFALWFYDQLGFSGADIQGQVVAAQPAFRGRALRLIEGDCPQGAEVLGSYDAKTLICSVPYGFDYLSQPACAALLDRVHGEFERQVGELLGSTIVGSFQDELPSLPTWSAGFADEFAHRRGYDLLPVLPALWGDQPTAVRADYQRTRAELAEEAFFRPLHEWHESRGLAVGCDQQHPSRAGYPLDSTQQYADYLKTHRWFSAPGSDHWGDAKVHSSLAHLYDRPRTWVEAFHGSGWGGTLEETFDWLLPWLRAGATLYNPHAVYYSTRGGRWEWAAPSTCWRQPYWRHHELFATAVARLCAALSWGDHVCDIAVLFPTSTVQADLDLGRPESLFSHGAGVSEAQDCYLDVVGRMHWYEPSPGELDRDGRDFDVVDEDSLLRAATAAGRLGIGAESYGVVVLPACRELPSAVLAVLRAFADDGGLVVSIGGAEPESWMRHVASASGLPGALVDLPRRVSAPTPTLLRSDGESSALLVLAAHPGATVQPGGDGWQTQGYDFDPARYASTVRIEVRGVTEPVAAWDPGTGASRALQATRAGDALVVDVPLDDSPCALVVFGPEATAALEVSGGMAATGSGGTRSTLLTTWTGSLLATLDNSWGDFAQPPSDGAMPIRLWHLDQQVDGGWEQVTVTFGPAGEVVGIGPVVWSDAAGAPGRLQGEEPRGYVPEAFLDLGEVLAGSTTSLRFRINAPEAASGWLSVGATAGKRLRWNDVELNTTGGPYYVDADVLVRAGENLLEVELVAATAGALKASWVLRPEPEQLPRPQWVTGRSVRRVVELTTAPTAAELQLGTVGSVTLSINGELVARHGEFDNYQQVRQPRVRRYDVTGQLRTGTNLIEIELADAAAAVVVDAFIDDLCVVTDADWQGVQGGIATVPHDPRWVQLRSRPHPLPKGHRLEGGVPARVLGDVTFGGGPTVDVFRVALPPGAVELTLPVRGRASVRFEGEAVALIDGSCRLAAPARAGSALLVTVEHGGQAAGGRLWAGPLEVRTESTGDIALGDWSTQGLRDWSGGVGYRTTCPASATATSLDLGRVRGTAEVRVNGRPAGCRIWSPYRFDVSGLLNQEENVIEVDVYNTLAPYIAAVSPSPWVLPGQTVSGLLGPVQLLSAQEPREDHDR